MKPFAALSGFVARFSRIAPQAAPSGLRFFCLVNLIKRVYEHRNELVDGFTKRFEVHDLVWYEVHERMESAILREKQMKKWTRIAKIDLIEKHNPEWRDLWPDLIAIPGTWIPAIPAGMTGLKHLCITMSAPAWKPLFCKFQLGLSSGSRSFKNPIPKQELGNEQANPAGRP